MDNKSKKLLMASAVAGLLTAGPGVVMADHHGAKEDGKVHCYGVNKCKGTGACGGTHADGEGYSCAGNNKCKGLGFLEIDKDTCLKIEGGRLTAKKDS